METLSNSMALPDAVATAAAGFSLGRVGAGMAYL
jgi:hypothetical protein